MNQEATPKALASAAASSPGNMRTLLLAAAAVVLSGLVLTQVAAVTPWRPTTAPASWQLHANSSELQAAELRAQALQNLQRQQQQQRLQEQQQQHLQELKEQHDKQMQTLSAVQQVQQEVQAGVQKLQQLYEKLASSPLASSTQQEFGTKQEQQARSTTEQGVICTVLRNEAIYVPEWVAFHLVLGATKVVIYDDNSTDALRQAVAPFGHSVVVIDMYKDVTGVPGDGSVHRVGNRQGWAYDHCKKTFAPSNGTGWLGIWDVDEFVYPCMRPSVQLQRNAIWDAYISSTNASAHGHALRCSLFGQNHNDTAQGNDTLVLLNNIRRAADGLTEPVAGPKVWEAVAAGCNQCGGCCQAQSGKTIYDINKVENIQIGTHGPWGENAVIDQSWQKPLGGLCCNHYQFKSTDEAKAKAAVNLNDHYTRVSSTPDAKKHLTMVLDTLVWQYVPDMLQLLLQKGFQYKVPQVPALIQHGKQQQ